MKKRIVSVLLVLTMVIGTAQVAVHLSCQMQKRIKFSKSENQ